MPGKDLSRNLWVSKHSRGCPIRLWGYSDDVNDSLLACQYVWRKEGRLDEEGSRMLGQQPVHETSKLFPIRASVDKPSVPDSSGKIAVVGWMEWT